jgi:hypothetical protein
MESWSTLVSQPKPSALQQAQQLSLVKYTAPACNAISYFHGGGKRLDRCKIKEYKEILHW